MRTQGEKIDDDDGHYVVVPDAQLGERCKPGDANVTVLVERIANHY